MKIDLGFFGKVLGFVSILIDSHYGEVVGSVFPKAFDNGRRSGDRDVVVMDGVRIIGGGDGPGRVLHDVGNCGVDPLPFEGNGGWGCIDYGRGAFYVQRIHRG